MIESPGLDFVAQSFIGGCDEIVDRRSVSIVFRSSDFKVFRIFARCEIVVECLVVFFVGKAFPASE